LQSASRRRGSRGIRNENHERVGQAKDGCPRAAVAHDPRTTGSGGRQARPAAALHRPMGGALCAGAFSNDKERVAEHTADVNRFIELLLTASRTAPVAVVGTVRADFYDPLIAHPEIKSLLPTRQVLLGSISRSELECTITEPAKKVGLAFDPPGLVQRVLDEAGEDAGMLPLLQYALKETGDLRGGNAITADSYARSAESERLSGSLRSKPSMRFLLTISGRPGSYSCGW